MKTFEIYYCYGGAYKGAYKWRERVIAADENEAVKIFSGSHLFEEIYSVTEITEPEQRKEPTGTMPFKVGEKVKDLSGIEGTVLSSDSFITRVAFAPDGGNWRDLKTNQLKAVNDTMPLWKRLDNARTKGQYFVDGGDYPEETLLRVRLNDENFDVCSFACDETENISSNAQYTALAVNNFASIVEALEKIHVINFHTPEQHMSAQEIEIHNIAKEALYKIR